MDLVNDLSSDVALAVLVEGRLRQKLEGQDAKSFIAHLEAELSRISGADKDPDHRATFTADLSH